ncbi:MAG: hypothetical protein AMXMBFR34_09680 [Myxococcaceae bacterium]
MMRSAWWTAVLLLAACGMGRDTEEYQAAVDELEATVATHEASAALTQTAADCASEQSRYDVAARAGVERLSGMAGAMDGMGRGMRGGPRPFAPMCQAMSVELSVHAGQACTGASSTWAAEVVRHCGAMREWLTQQRQAVTTHCGR